MSIRYRIWSKDIERLKRRARELKRRVGMPHHQALDLVAQQLGLAHWHHVITAHAAMQPTELAFRRGLVIALDIKDALDLGDTAPFVRDDDLAPLCRADLYQDLCHSLDEELQAPMSQLYDERELQSWCDEVVNEHFFYRWAGHGAIPSTTEDILAVVRTFSFWPPRYVWRGGQFLGEPSHVALAADGSIAGVRF